MAEVTTIQLYGTAETDNIANVDMPDDGAILGAYIVARCSVGGADLDAISFELNFASVSSIITNDARSVIAIAAAHQRWATAAGFMNLIAEANIDLRPGIKVFGGERVYLHGTVIGGGLNVACRALLICQFSKFTARRR